MGRTGLIVLLGSIAAVPIAAQRPDLAGRWALQRAPDEEQSDTTAARAVPPAPPAAAPRRSPARSESFLRQQRQINLLVGMAGAVPSFTIAQTDTSLTVTNEDGFTYVLHPGREDRLMILDTLEVRYRTRWDGRSLEVEWRPEGGGKLIERYQLSDSGTFLRVDVTVENGRFNRWEARMYRRVDEENEDRTGGTR